MEIADGWHEEEIGRSRGGLPLKLYRPAAGGQIDGLLIAGEDCGLEVHAPTAALNLD
jgi:hypothetical protein